MKTFEYKIEDNLGENNLNTYGLEGWELVSVSKIKTPHSEDTKFYFKRKAHHERDKV